MILPVIDCQGTSCRVSLRRQRGRDAHILGNSGPFDVSSEPEDSLALTNAVAVGIQRTFADHRPRADAEPARGEERRLRAVSLVPPAHGRRPGADQRRRRRAGADRTIVARPGRGLASSRPAPPASQGPARALRILREADARTPEDPRLAYERFMLELETGALADAAQALAELERRAPGDVRVLRARARFLVAPGQAPRGGRGAAPPGARAALLEEPLVHRGRRDRPGRRRRRARAPPAAARAVARQSAGAGEAGRAGVAAGRSRAGGPHLRGAPEGARDAAERQQPRMEPPAGRRLRGRRPTPIAGRSSSSPTTP